MKENVPKNDGHSNIDQLSNLATMDATLTECLYTHLNGWCTRGLFVVEASGAKIDICNVIDAPPPGVVNLCPIRYPPTHEGFKVLYKELQDQVCTMGFDLNISRSRHHGTDQHIGCSRSKTFHVTKGSRRELLMLESNATQFTYQSEVKEAFLRGFNKNDIRPGGKCLSRRTSTARPLNNEDKCCFGFLLKCSSTHWFLRRGIGEYHHSGHCKRLHHTNVSSLTPREKLLITDMKSSQISNIAVRQLFYFSHGKTLNYSQIKWINTCFERDNDLSSPKTNGVKRSDTDNLISYLNNDSTISFILLYDDSGSKLIGGRPKGRPGKTVAHIDNASPDVTLIAKTYLNDGTSVPDQSINIPAKENIVLSKYSTNQKKKVFIGVAWVTDNERRLYNTFPEVSFVDTTSQTNKELRPLLMMCGKDSQSQPFVALRFIMPSEQRWTFKWFYEIAAPLLLGDKACSRKHLGITDGDPNEYMSFTSSMGKHYPKSIHLLCRWHLITHNTNKHHFGSRGHPLGGPIFAKELKSWLHSLCLTPETKDEYTYSVTKLMEWLNSYAVKGATSRHEEAREYVVTKILPHEDKYAYYKWMYIRGFNETTNSSGESLNSSSKQTKMNPVGVAPNMSLCTSATTLNTMSSLKTHSKHVHHDKNMISQPLWAFTSIKGNITDYAQGILKMQYQSSHDYLCLQVSPYIWKVKKEKVTMKRPVYPTFIRTRTVCVNRSFLICDCGFWQRMGIPCRHIIKVCKGNIDIDDIALRWRKDYLTYFLQPGYEAYTKMCEKYIDQCPLGPIFTWQHCQNHLIRPPFTQEWFYQNVEAVDGLSELNNIQDLKPPSKPRSSKSKSHTESTGLTQDINLSQNVLASSSSNNASEKQTSNQAPLLPPGGAYHVLAPIFQSISSMAELDSETLAVALSGLRKVHADVSMYINEKTDKLDPVENSELGFVSSSFATSRGEISRLKKI